MDIYHMDELISEWYHISVELTISNINGYLKSFGRLTYFSYSGKTL